MEDDNKRMVSDIESVQSLGGRKISSSMKDEICVCVVVVVVVVVVVLMVLMVVMVLMAAVE